MAFFGMPKLGTAALFRGIAVAIVCSDSSEIGYSERGTNHWLVGKHIWEVWAFSCPFCVRVSLHSLLDAIGITRLGLTVSGLFLTGVVLKAVPKVVPYRAHDPVFITFIELIGNILVPRRGLEPPHPCEY